MLWILVLLEICEEFERIVQAARGFLASTIQFVLDPFDCYIYTLIIVQYTNGLQSFYTYFNYIFPKFSSLSFSLLLVMFLFVSMFICFRCSSHESSHTHVVRQVQLPTFLTHSRNGLPQLLQSSAAKVFLILIFMFVIVLCRKPLQTVVIFVYFPS